MKKRLIMACVVSLTFSACTLTGGETAYTIEPVPTGGGDIVCCKVTVNNTKDYDKLKFRLDKRPDGSISVSLDESGVSASDPAAVASANQSKLIDAVTKLIPITGNGG